MSYPVPDRLVPIRAEESQRKVTAVLAIVAVILAILAGLDVSIGSLSPFDLLAFAIAAVALHLAYPVAFPVRSRPVA